MGYDSDAMAALRGKTYLAAIKNCVRIAKQASRDQTIAHLGHTLNHMYSLASEGQINIESAEVLSQLGITDRHFEYMRGQISAEAKLGYGFSRR